MSRAVGYLCPIVFVVGLLLALSQALPDPVVRAYDPTEEVVIRPPTGAGSGSGSFDYLDYAIDTSAYTGAVGSVAARCSTTCLNEVEKSAVWQGFPDGFEPYRLEVSWDAVGGILLNTGRAAQVNLLLEYDLGSGWQTAQEETWDSQIPSCSETYASRCDENVFVKELDPEQSTGVIKVRATITAKMTTYAPRSPQR